MPNTGRPSKDCELCRSRRVKCDLGRPSCQRCIKYGVECPGYRSLQELVFRNSGASSVKKRKALARQAGKTASPAPSEYATIPLSLTYEDDAEVVELTSREVPRSSRDVVFHSSPRLVINEHWTSHSIPLILDLYAHIGFLHQVYREHHRDGPLLWASHLFTRTYVTNLQYPTSMSTQSRVDTQQELGAYLGKTLSSISAAIASPEGALRDDVLATVWILANYEILMGSVTGGSDHSSPWHLHTRGLYSLLKSRGNKQFYTEMGRMGFWPSFNMLQIQAIISNEKCPPESDEWLEILMSTMHPDEYFALHVSIFVNRIASIQARIIGILNEGSPEIAEQQYRDIVQQLTIALSGIEEAYPSDPVGDVLDHYMHLMRCSVVVKVHAIVQLLVNFLTHQQECLIPFDELKAQWYSSLRAIRHAAQEILATAPAYAAKFATSNSMSSLFEGLKVIWPLTAICSVSGTLPEQKEAAYKFLVLVGRQSGVRQAFKHYEHGSLLSPQIRQPLGFG